MPIYLQYLPDATVATRMTGEAWLAPRTAERRDVNAFSRFLVQSYVAAARLARCSDVEEHLPSVPPTTIVAGEIQPGLIEVLRAARGWLAAGIEVTLAQWGPLHPEFEQWLRCRMQVLMTTWDPAAVYAIRRPVGADGRLPPQLITE